MSGDDWLDLLICISQQKNIYILPDQVASLVLMILSNSVVKKTLDYNQLYTWETLTYWALVFGWIHRYFQATVHVSLKWLSGAAKEPFCCCFYNKTLLQYSKVNQNILLFLVHKIIRMCAVKYTKFALKQLMLILIMYQTVKKYKINGWMEKFHQTLIQILIKSFLLFCQTQYACVIKQCWN